MGQLRGLLPSGGQNIFLHQRRFAWFDNIPIFLIAVCNMTNMSVDEFGKREVTLPSGLRVELARRDDLEIRVRDLDVSYYGPAQDPDARGLTLDDVADDVSDFLSPVTTPGNSGFDANGFAKNRQVSPTSTGASSLSNLFHATAATATQGPAKRQRIDKRGRHWMSVWNNPEESSIDILLGLRGLVKYSIQHEVGANGTPHLQGVLTFANAKFWSELDNACKDPITGKSRCWFDKIKNLQAAKNYCRKQKTATGRCWRKGYKGGGVPLVDPLEGKELYNFQQRIIDIVNGPVHDRLIYWFFSSKGGIGKSALVKSLVMNYGALICGGKKGDMFYAVNKMVEKGDPPDLVVFDIPRSQGATVAYDGIECIKNGCFFSSKYESGACIMNTPHIIVFANMGPVIHMMSNDRWAVTDLDLEIDLRDVGTE